jgi:hypothetical protein
MKTAALVLIALFFCGCGERQAPPVVQGSIATPGANSNVTDAAQQLIAGQANAEAKGDHKTANAIKGALVQEDKQEIAGNDRWLITAGSLIIAIGLGIMWYLGPKLGGGVAIVGAGMVGCGLFVSAILPYREAIGLGGLGIAVTAALIHFRKYVSAVFHMAHGTEHLAGVGVKDLINKIKQRGPGVLTRLKAILHHAPIVTAQTVTTNPTKAP